jgi:hypothetical protein
MKNVVSFIDKWGGRISFVLIILVFFKTCNTNNKILKTEEKVSNKLNVMDSTVNTINNKVISQEEMVVLIKETPFWKSLELEELSDKNRIPINQLKNNSENQQ